MRKIGTLESAQDAEKFHHFLLASGIENRIDPVPPAWEIWVLSDDDLDRAKAELESFINFPQDPRFKVPPISPVRSKQKDSSRISQRQISRDIPVTRFLFVGCILLTIYTGMGKLHPEVMQWLKFSVYKKPEGMWVLPPEIMRGELWRIFTPIFVHGSFMHLAFNLYLLWLMGNTIERTKGSVRFLVYCLMTAAGAHFTQYVIVGPNFIGISGVVYGLLGYLWMKQMVSPSEGYRLPDQLVATMFIWLILGISGMLDAWGIPVANGAHFGGLLVGMLLGAYPQRHSASI